MPYVNLYDEDEVSDGDIFLIIKRFMENNKSFEASNWTINKLKDGSYKQFCCDKCGPKYFKSLEEWFSQTIVYPDEEQWVN